MTKRRVKRKPSTNLKDKNIVVQNITIKAPQRKSQDIENWRAAIKTFENEISPNKVLLYDLYEDMLLDGQLESTWGKRQDAVSNKELLFLRDGKEDEEIIKLLNSPDMRELIKDLHDSTLWGYTLVQVDKISYDPDEEMYKIKYDLIPRKHVHPEPNFQCISKMQGIPAKDILFKEPPLSKYMIWAGKAKNKGLMVKAAQYIIYKRGDFGDWAQFAEMFGMPFREGRYDGYDEKTRALLEQAMEEAAGASYAILPKEAEFKIHETFSNTGSNSLYKDLKDACNAEISKIILGNTLTTEQGDKGARSLGDVHADAESAKNLADELFITGILNSKFKAILKLFGFNVSGGSIQYKGADKDWDTLVKKWGVYSDMKDKNIPIDDDYIYEEFDIPKPDDYDQQKEEGKQNQVLSTFKNTFKEGSKEEQPKNFLNKIFNFFE